jgi:hypothetical protein
MPRLEKRLAALEKFNFHDDGRIDAIIRRIVHPSQTREANHVYDAQGRAWDLNDGESESSLIDRALGETQRSKLGLAWLVVGHIDRSTAIH